MALSIGSISSLNRREESHRAEFPRGVNPRLVWRRCLPLWTIANVADKETIAHVAQPRSRRYNNVTGCVTLKPGEMPKATLSLPMVLLLSARSHRRVGEAGGVGRELYPMAVL